MMCYGYQCLRVPVSSRPTCPHVTRNTRRSDVGSGDRTRIANALIGVLAIFLGGSLGAALRGALPDLPLKLTLASSSLLPNAIACLAIGALHTGRERLHSLAATLGIVGFCGGLSTFSGFAVSVASQWASGEPVQAMLAATLEVGLGVALVLVGCLLVKRTLSRLG